MMIMIPMIAKHSFMTYRFMLIVILFIIRFINTMMKVMMTVPFMMKIAVSKTVTTITKLKLKMIIN